MHQHLEELHLSPLSGNEKVGLSLEYCGEIKCNGGSFIELNQPHHKAYPQVTLVLVQKRVITNDPARLIHTP